MFGAKKLRIFEFVGYSITDIPKAKDGVMLDLNFLIKLQVDYIIQ
jgi:hypothetical protein